jgi:hypothetical protein
VTREQALAIFAGQRAAGRRRLEYATVWARLGRYCRTRAESYAASARQAFDLAEAAAKEYARVAPGNNDQFERAVSGLLSALDERDELEASAPEGMRPAPAQAVSESWTSP